MTWSGQSPLMRGGRDACGNAESTPISVAMVASSSVAGKTRAMSSATGRAVSSDLPKSPVSDVADIDRELRDERLVEAERLSRCFVLRLAGALADHGEHRVDRDDAADEEGDEEQAEEGDEQAERRLRNAPGRSGQAGAGAGPEAPRRRAQAEVSSSVLGSGAPVFVI